MGVETPKCLLGLIVRVACRAVASRNIWHIRGVDHRLHVLEIVVQRADDEHQRAVGDEVAGPAVTVGAQQAVESAASLFLDQICFLSLNLRVVDIHVPHILRLG